MSAAGHTPGPWEVRPDEDGRGYFRIRGTRLARLFKVANVLFGSAFDRAEALANARLIAASPELLEALEDILSEYVRDIADAGDEDPEEKAIVKFARAAITKATA